MNTLFDEKRLRRLIANLNILTGVPANILDAQGRDRYLFGGHPILNLNYRNYEYETDY